MKTNDNNKRGSNSKKSKNIAKIKTITTTIEGTTIFLVWYLQVMIII